MEGITRTILFISFVISIIRTTKSEKILQNYNGALTEITCAATVPSFLINGIYTPQHYHQLPDLFGIEAKVALDRSNVTLHVNGSILANNVIVVCQNLVDPVAGETEIMFQFALLFADTIPAPHDVQYDDINGILSWSPPLLEDIFANHSIDVTLRITHYIIYITDLTNGLATNFTTTGPETSIALFTVMPTMPCSMSIEVSAVNPAGEGHRSTGITNQCNPVHVTRPEDSATQDIDNEKESSAKRSALSYGGIIAVVIAILFVVIIVVCIMILLIVCSFTKNRNTKSKAVNEEELSKPRSHSGTSESSELSQTTELFTPDNSSPSTPKQPTMTQHQLQCLQNSQETNNSNQGKTQVQRTQDGRLIYAELAPSVLNPISQPSSVDSTTYAVINTTNQTLNLVYTH